MTSPRTRRSKKATPDGTSTPPRVAQATRQRRRVTTGASANAPQPQAQGRADTERLLDRMQEANERLIVAAVNAQNLSDTAHLEAAQARVELDHLMSQLRAISEQLATTTKDAREREQKYRRLSVRLLTLQDEERRRLALELHDSTGQCLAALMMNLDLVGRAKRALDGRSRRALAESRALADRCAREVRTFAYLLHPPLLDEMGLRSAVRWYAEGFTKRSGIHVVVELDDVGRLSQPIETALFRVVQESLTNVHRHASTSTASIRLTMTAGIVALQIHDRVRRRRDRTAHQTGALELEALGVGIQGMRERIRQLGGTFDVEFTNKGTTVCVGVPLNADTP